ncbi:hypothetical protein [Citrifermentans bremense]|uniref:hypothetical protein n=1 Tax=Citrifermentans bremense TaxID=60035 RepID=UPI00041A741E|nr:hypothetical protein [Citrifermentans bremense]
MTETIDAEVEATMKIEAEAMDLCLSDTLEVDFRRGNSPLTLHWITERHTCLKKDPETIIVIDLKEMTAWRLKSQLLPGLDFIDCITETNQFLFLDLERERYCRAVLDGVDSRFTSIFSFPPDAFDGEDLYYEILFMSESKECEYYLSLSDPEEHLSRRVARFSINNSRNNMHRCSFPSKMLDIKRLADPDSFAIATEDELMLCSRSL